MVVCIRPKERAEQLPASAPNFVSMASTYPRPGANTAKRMGRRCLYLSALNRYLAQQKLDYTDWGKWKFERSFSMKLIDGSYSGG